MRRRMVLAVGLIALALAPASSAGELPLAANLVAETAAAELQPAQARTAPQVVVDLSIGRLELLEGVVVPSTPIGGRAREFVFVGQARIAIVPPDPVEALQLENHFGRREIDRILHNFVLVSGDPVLVEQLISSPKVDLTATQLATAKQRYEEWRSQRTSKFGIRGAILALAAGDPAYSEYLSLWGLADRIDGLFYERDPSQFEPITVGLLNHSRHWLERDSFWCERYIKRNERKDDDEPAGWPMENTYENEGFAEYWVRSRIPEDPPRRGTSGFRAVEYEIETTVQPEELTIESVASIKLQAQRPSRVVSFALFPDLEVKKVQTKDGSDLTWHRIEDAYDLYVVLPQFVDDKEHVDLVLTYEGEVLARAGQAFRMRTTTHWYPQTDAPRALFQTEFRWPEGFDLLSSGKRVDGGAADGMRWESRRLDFPALAISFEVGHFDIHEERIGPFQLVVAFNRDIAPAPSARARQQTILLAKSAIAFFSRRFGMYPLDHFTMVTTPQYFSQGLLGFSTITHHLMFDDEASIAKHPSAIVGRYDGSYKPGQLQRIETIAHEVAHQWWGNVVGWDSYRDQWLSESLADYSSLLFTQDALRDQDVYLAKYAGNWRRELDHRVADGRAITDLGPVTLGGRLPRRAYKRIVYTKGSIVFSTLTQIFGQDAMTGALKKIAADVSGGTISTERFVDLLEQATATQLDGFADRYVYGTSIPQIFYSYDAIRGAGNEWIVEGEIEQVIPQPWHYRLAKGESGGWAIQRRPRRSEPVSDWSLALPVAAAGSVGRQARAVKGRKNQILLDGPRVRFRHRLDARPERFEFDSHGQVLATFVSETDDPRVAAHLRALVLAAEGKRAEALALIEQVALDGDADESLDLKARVERSSAHMEAARLKIDMGDFDGARKHIRTADAVLEGHDEQFAFARNVLRARIELAQGKNRSALNRMHDGFCERITQTHNPDRSRHQLDYVEAHLIAAAAAAKKGDVELALFLADLASQLGADVQEFTDTLSTHGSE